jgi:outer membrane murein-binding lipoprotein Lpp
MIFQRNNGVSGRFKRQAEGNSKKSVSELSMLQKIEPLNAVDLADLEARRGWVSEHGRTKVRQSDATSSLVWTVNWICCVHHCPRRRSTVALVPIYAKCLAVEQSANYTSETSQHVIDGALRKEAERHLQALARPQARLREHQWSARSAPWSRTGAASRGAAHRTGILAVTEGRMADEHENLVLVLLRQLGDKIDRVDDKVDRVAADQTAMNAKVDRLDVKVNGLDAKFNRLDAKVDRTDQKVDSVIKQQIDMQHDVSMLRHSIAPGEMEAVNNDIAQFRRELSSLTARVDQIEKDHGR